MRRGLAEQLLAVKHQTPLDLHRPIGLTKPGADVAKSVDAADLKSAGLVSCGFKSRRPHHPGSNGIAFSSVTFGRGYHAGNQIDASLRHPQALESDASGAYPRLVRDRKSVGEGKRVAGR